MAIVKKKVLVAAMNVLTSDKPDPRDGQPQTERFLRGESAKIDDRYNDIERLTGLKIVGEDDDQFVTAADVAAAAEGYGQDAQSAPQVDTGATADATASTGNKSAPPSTDPGNPATTSPAQGDKTQP